MLSNRVHFFVISARWARINILETYGRKFCDGHRIEFCFFYLFFWHSKKRKNFKSELNQCFLRSFEPNFMNNKTSISKEFKNFFFNIQIYPLLYDYKFQRLMLKKRKAVRHFRMLIAQSLYFMVYVLHDIRIANLFSKLWFYNISFCFFSPESVQFPCDYHYKFR